MARRLAPTVCSVLPAARTALLGALALAAGVAACDGVEAAGDGGRATLFAAASTRDAVEELVRAFEAETGATVRVSLASSAALARQIDAGAQADLFLSAHPRWTDYLVERGRVAAAERTELATNALCWVTPAAARYAVRLEPGAPPPYAALAGRVAIGEPRGVPVGIYARSALEELGWWAALEPRLVPALDARAVLRLVERGEVEAGIVYASDAAGSEAVHVAAVFPRATHEPVRYVLAAVGSDSPTARALLRHLTGEAARDVFRRHGFGAGGAPER